MESTHSKPIQIWAQGATELLEYGLRHMHMNSEQENRMAMILVDNSIEQMIKTWLGLPKRLRGCEGPSRKKLDEVSVSFPLILECFEEYAGNRCDPENLAIIEYGHRVRNMLYHSGMGVTVQRDKLELYASVAQLLIHTLFGIEIEKYTGSAHYEKTGRFINSWNVLELLLEEYYSKKTGYKKWETKLMLEWMFQNGVLQKPEFETGKSILDFRNMLLHGNKTQNATELEKWNHKLLEFIQTVKMKNAT